MFLNLPSRKTVIGLAFNEMCYYLKERLEGIQFHTSSVTAEVLACESQSKDTTKVVCHNVHVVECD
jgi:hypothetical protein